MKTLNLVYPDKSDIKYKISKFPNGQQNIVITGVMSLEDMGDINPPKWFGPYLNKIGKQITIKSRLNNWLDLELITCAVASLRELGVEEIHLYTPYFLGARSDRKFEEGGNNYLKDIICPIINSLNFKTVTCIDPHSDVLEACIKGFRKENNLELVKFSLSSMLKLSEDTGKFYNDDFILVSPDAGASKKIYKLAEQIGYKGDIITCSKDRDTDGKLTKTVVPISNEQHNMLHKGPYKDFIIIDDICDGGTTFINIAKEIKQYFHESGKTQSKIYLIVTHGIFSGEALRLLNDNFNGVYCTNSYSDIENLVGGVYTKNFKQLNVF